MIEAPLSQFSTIGIGGSAQKLVVARSEEEIIAAVQAADSCGGNILVMGGGSNVLLPDADSHTGIGFDGAVVLVASDGIKEEAADSAEVVLLEVQAGCSWDRFVEYTVLKGLSGVEVLSGIPGTVGAAPIQNIGAYGAEVQQAVVTVRVWDRHQQRVLTLTPKDLGFSYRSSLLKKMPCQGRNYSLRYIVLAVKFQLSVNELSSPLRYHELARHLGVEVGKQAPMAHVREAVLELRAAKGMIIDRNDRDTYSTGSFFINPVVTAVKAAELPAEMPQYPQSFKRGTDGLLIPDTLKLSAAWLIDNAGFGKGYGLEDTPGYEVTAGRVSLSTKHTLALTNRGLDGAPATQKDVLTFKNHIEEGVLASFGVLLEPETVIVQA